MEPIQDRELKTSRLYIEPLVEKHAELLFELLQDHKIYTFIPEKPPASISALRKRYKLLEKRKSPSLPQIWLNWALRLRENGKYIGTLQATIDDNKTAFIAYVLSPKFWRQGLAFEACVKLLEFLFAEYQIIKIFADVDKNNKSSINLLTKLGFAITMSRSSKSDYFYELTNEAFFQKFR